MQRGGVVRIFLRVVAHLKGELKGASVSSRVLFPSERYQVGSAATDDVRNIVYFDLETMRAADEVGGWKHIDKMGMSIRCDLQHRQPRVFHLSRV